jgi:hypothetical protein
MLQIQSSKIQLAALKNWYECEETNTKNLSSQISAQPTNKHMACINYKFANREN